MAFDALKAAVRGEPDAVKAVSAALKARDPSIAAALPELGSSDLARLVLQLKPGRARDLVKLLPDAPGIAVLGALDPSIRARLLDDGERRRIAKIAARLKPQATAEFLAGAPQALIEETLAIHPKAGEVRQSMAYGDESAAAVMRRDFVATPETWTLREVVEEVRRHADDMARLRAVYVIDDGGRLVGYLKVRDLILQAPEARVADAMRTDVVAVTAGTDREELLALAEANDLDILPVVDEAGILLGIVTGEELVEISREEADEDIKLLSGVARASTGQDSAFRIVPRRLPWLAGGLVGSGIAAVVVGSYEDALTEAAILASLIPIVMSLAGNAGIQASTVTVQAMSSGNYWIGDLVGRTLREFAGAAMNGAIIGAIVTVGILVFSTFVGIERPAYLALSAALTIVIVTVQASVIGSLVPVALRALSFDPAVATGVFITTSNDVVGVLVFFIIATAIYL